MFQPLTLISPELVILQIEQHVERLSVLLSESPNSPESEAAALIIAVEHNAKEVINCLREDRLREAKFLAGFVHNTVLCIGAYHARLAEDLTALALTNFRLYQLATGKIALPA